MFVLAGVVLRPRDGLDVMPAKSRPRVYIRAGPHPSVSDNPGRLYDDNNNIELYSRIAVLPVSGGLYVHEEVDRERKNRNGEEKKKKQTPNERDLFKY